MQTIIIHGKSQREYLRSIIDKIPDDYAVEIKPRRRTHDQNAKLWPTLTDISKQVVWHGQKLTPDEWKDFFTAALRKQKIVPNLDGDGFIVLGKKTSTMNKMEFSELIELAVHFGDERGVVWSNNAP